MEKWCALWSYFPGYSNSKRKVNLSQSLWGSLSRHSFLILGLHRRSMTDGSGVGKAHNHFGYLFTIQNPTQYGYFWFSV